MNFIQLQQGGSVVTLHGAGAGVPFRGAVLAGERGEQVEIVLSLRGTAAEIEGGLAQVGRMLAQARRGWIEPGVEKVYLVARAGADGAAWRTPLKGGRVEPLGAGADARAGGTQGARIVAEREDWWEESAERSLWLSSFATPRAESAVTVHNHWDDGHANWIELAAADTAGHDPAGHDLSGEIEAPVRVEIVSSLAAQGTIYCGCSALAGIDLLQPSLEGESGTVSAGASLSTTADAGASAGAYASITWTGAGSITAGWTLPWYTLTQMGGDLYLPVARLARKLAPGEWFGRWRLAREHVGGKDVLWESRGGLLDTTRGLQTGAAAQIPPWVVAASVEESLRIEWEVRAAGEGAHELHVDFVYLLPLSRWRIYRPALRGMDALVAREDPWTGTLAGAGGLRAYSAEGPGLVMVPGVTNRFYFLMGTETGVDTPNAAAAVRLWVRARKRVL